MQNPLSFTTSEDCLSPTGQDSDGSINSKPQTVQEVRNRSLQRINNAPRNMEGDTRLDLDAILLSSSPASPKRDHSHTKQLEEQEKIRRSGGMLYKLLARESSKSIANIISRSSVNLRGSNGIKKLTSKVEEQERNRRLEDKEGATIARMNAREVSECISELGWPGFVQGPRFILNEEYDDGWWDVPLSGELRRRASAVFDSPKNPSSWLTTRRTSSPAIGRFSSPSMQSSSPRPSTSSPASDRRLSKSMFLFSPSGFNPDRRFSSPRVLSARTSTSTSSSPSPSPSTSTSSPSGEENLLPPENVRHKIMKTPTNSPDLFYQRQQQQQISQSDSSPASAGVLLTPTRSTEIARVSSLARVAALALEECGTAPTTEWAFSPRTKPAMSPKRAFFHSQSHESGLVSPKKPAPSRSFSFKELRLINNSVTKHEKIAEREAKKADKYEEKADKLAVQGKLARAEESRSEAALHRQEAQKHLEAADTEKAKVTPGSSMSRKVSPTFVAVAGSPVQ